MVTVRRRVRKDPNWQVLVGGGDPYPVSVTDPGPTGDAFILGTTKPTAANTGVGIIGPARAQLTQVTGDLIVTTAGTVVENQERLGRILIRAANVTVRNCVIKQPVISAAGWCVDTSNAAAVNATIEFCELYENSPSTNSNGIGPNNYTAYRNNIHDTVDGLSVFTYDNGPANVYIRGNYVHDLLFLSPEPRQSDNRTHSDVIQFQGGGLTEVIGNTLSCFASVANSTPSLLVNHPQALSVFMFSPNSSLAGGVIRDVKIWDNWCYGGEFGLNAGAPTNSTTTNVTVYRNRFDRDQWYQPGWAINVDPSATGISVPTTGGNVNVYEDNGATVIPKNG